MPLQDIAPINDQPAELIVLASAPWIEKMKPGMAWVKVLWTGLETGRCVVLRRWKKGCGA